MSDVLNLLLKWLEVSPFYHLFREKDEYFYFIFFKNDSVAERL